MQHPTHDDFGGPTREENARRLKTAMIVARLKQRAAYAAVRALVPGEEGAVVLPTFRLTDKGHVINGAGISLPYVSMQHREVR